jgi:hypothetical protein
MRNNLKTVLIADRHTGYREEKAWAIASVYTPIKFRRQGMAALLLNEVKKWFDGEADCETSFLYSDIGPVSVDTYHDQVYLAEMFRNTTQCLDGPPFRPELYRLRLA